MAYLYPLGAESFPNSRLGALFGAEKSTVVMPNSHGPTGDFLSSAVQRPYSKVVISVPNYPTSLNSRSIVTYFDFFIKIH
jgi:hypothetical protein